MIDLVDTHCHIQSAGLEVGERTTRELWAKAALDRDVLVKRAVGEGVTRMICVGCDLEDSRLAVEFVQAHPECWASIGIHPHEAQHYIDGENSSKLANFAALVHQPKVVAVGECGLDYYYEHSPKQQQIKVLRFQLELAQSANLPVIFHVREAFDDFWPILDQYPDTRGVLHSFTDSAENLAKALERGLYIGVNGIATFAKDDGRLDVYRSIPLEKLLLETDAPFLTPVPYRGKINEPMRVGTIAEFLAELRHENRETLALETTSNAQQLFGI
jgi:TatD DNase family protein